MNLADITRYIAEENLDGWLFYNFQNRDSCANEILEMPPERLLTRRWFYLISTQGEPIKLVHKIESAALDHLPGIKKTYAGWKELQKNLEETLQGKKNICMQYSPNNSIPYVSYVDAGTVECIRNLGVQVHSSANLLQRFNALWDENALQSHLEVADLLREIVLHAFRLVGEHIQENKQITEHDVQQFILQQFENNNLFTDHLPIVAANQHSGDPHYETLAQGSTILKPNDFLLIDLWAKQKTKNAVYADITWVASISQEIQPIHQKIFNIVKEARDAAVEFVQTSFAQQTAIQGYQVDDICRNYITDKGYGDYFIHRTGHNIERELHGRGVHMDNYETRDERYILNNMGFSIEPGIYLPEFGVRLELNMYTKDNQAYVSGMPVQDQIIAIMKK